MVVLLEPIATPRLRLRLFVHADQAALFDLHANPDEARYLSREVRSQEEIRAVISRRACRTRLDLPGDGIVLAIERIDDGRLIGECSLWLRDARTGEIGFAIAPEHQGLGYAREAAAAMIEFAAQTRLIDVVYGTVDIDNHASIRLLNRLGLTRRDPVAGDEQHLRFSSETLPPDA